MSNGVGSYLRHIPSAAEKDEFNEGARRALNGLGPSPTQPTAEQVKMVFEAAQREDQREKEKVISAENAAVWLSGHPEFEKTAANISLMNHELQSRFGLREYSIEDYEIAYESLCASNFLQLNKTVLAAQKHQTDKQRYEAAKARTAAIAFDPNKNYDELSLDEIRKRAADDTRRQMQRRGEEGGW